MHDNNHNIRICVNDDQHRKIRIAAALSDQSMAKFMHVAVLQAADNATADIDVTGLSTMNSTEDARNE